MRVAFYLIVVVFVAANSSSATGNVPAFVEVTGQNRCWAASDVSFIPRPNQPREIPCMDSDAAGQDGALRAGVPFPAPRFTVNVDLNGDGDCSDDRETCDGTVTDNLTGLIWLRDTDCFGNQTWAEALELANNLQDLPNDHGDCSLRDKSSKGDWRLPNVKELQSLIDFGYSDPALSNAAGSAQCRDTTDCAFMDLGSGRTYWSSTTFLVPLTDTESLTDTEVVNKAWSVDVGNGNTLPHFRWHSGTSSETDTRTKFFIWPVKGPISGIGAKPNNHAASRKVGHFYAAFGSDQLASIPKNSYQKQGSGTRRHTIIAVFHSG